MGALHERNPEKSSRAEIRRVAFAAFAGTALEWYDYFLYGTAAAIVFNRLYFATHDPVVATSAAFASFAIGFVARPVGALIFGHVGDRYGRRITLLITVTGIGAVTGLIGLLPTYAEIGVAAPILLTALRILQGISLGGEWGGAVTLVIEHAPPERRGRYAALLQLGAPVATLLSAGAFALVSLLPDQQFDSWGWRLPFLAAIPLLGVAVYVRKRIGESPMFLDAAKTAQAIRLPLVEVARQHWPRLLIGLAASLLPVGGFYIITTFSINYGTDTLGVSRTVMLTANLVAAALEILVVVACGRATERFGAGPVCAVGGLATAAVAFPMFMLLGTTQPALVVLAVCAGVACQAVSYAVMGVLLAELFPAQVRASGVAISYNFAAAIGGLMPLAATSLLAAGGQQFVYVALLLVAVALATAGAGALGGRHRLSDDVQTGKQLSTPAG
jgi:MFS family permease